MDLVPAIHASPALAVITVTGGGSGAIERLLTVPGASGTVLEARVPYAHKALADWLGKAPEQSCSAETARQIAMASFQRSRELTAEQPDLEHDLVGIGCTASLVSDRPKRGEHRLHVAAQTSTRTLCLSMLLEKGKRTRQEEEQVATHAVVATLAEAAGVHSMDLTKRPPGIEASFEEKQAPREWTDLLLGKRDLVAVHGAPNDLRDSILIPGSFNPMHEGHEEMARIAAEQTGRKVVCELAIRNVDKPMLDFIEIEKRLKTLSAYQVALTAAPTFLEKARLAPGAVFAVGADTIRRVAELRYYQEGQAGFDQSLVTLRNLGCSFLVFGRTLDGEFLSLEELQLPSSLEALCDSVSENEFRIDISSTELRQDVGD